MDGSENRPLEEYFEAWLDAQADGLAERPSDSPSLAELTDSDLTALFERAGRCAELLNEVWGKVAADATAGLDAPTPPQADPGPPAIPPGRRFGRFQIIRLLGYGGMGTVFLAFDPRLGRRVALKTPYPGSLMQPETRERFLREARAAGALKHPGIVPVFESAGEEWLCYLVSEYCEGPTLAQWLKERDEPVPVEMAAAVVACLAGAVQHAHDQGVLHRDLKPSNVLLDRFDKEANANHPLGSSGGHQPELPFVPRITDFGLAHLADQDAELTRTGMAVGTAAYMAPEQAEGRREVIGGGSDVFALGAILYELLTGQPPFARDSTGATLAALRQSDPVPPGRHRGDVPRDLEAVVLKCLEKEPQQRYRSAAALHDDLERFLRGEPTAARPISRIERVWRLARRYPAAAALVALSLLTLMGLVVGLSWHAQRLGAALADAQRAHGQADAERRRAEEEALRAEAERGRAEAGEAKSRQLLYAADMARAIRAWRENEPLRVLEILGQHVPEEGEEDLRGFEWHFLQASCRPQPDAEFRHPAAVQGVAATPDGREVITACDDGCVRIWDVGSGDCRAVLSGHFSIVRGVAVSPDGSHLVSGGDDHLVLLWDLRKGRLVRMLGAHRTGVETVAWSPDGKWIATGARYSDVRLWSADKGLVFTIPDDGRHESLVFSSDARLLYVPEKYRLAVWDLEQRKRLHQRDPHAASGPRAMCAIGQRFVASSDRFTEQVVVFDPASRTPATIFTGDCLYSRGFAASPDGRYLASAGRDGALRLFDVGGFHARSGTTASAGLPEKQGVSLAISAHPGTTTAVAFLDAVRVVTTGDDGLARVWDVGKLSSWSRLGPSGHVKRVNLGANETVLRAPGHGETGWLDFSRRQPSTATAPWHGGQAVQSPDERWFARVVAGGRVEIWDIPRRAVHGLLPDDVVKAEWLEFSPDGCRLAVVAPKNVLSLCDVERRELRWRVKLDAECRALRFSPDGRLLAAAPASAGFLVFDAAARKIARRVDTGAQEMGALDWSPDGRLLAAECDDTQIGLWDTREWRLRGVFTGHTDDLECVQFSPDGRTLLSGGHDGTIRAWHIPTGRPLGVLYQTPYPGETINDIRVSSDRRFVVAATQQTKQPAIVVSRAFGEADTSGQ